MGGCSGGGVGSVGSGEDGAVAVLGAVCVGGVGGGWWAVKAQCERWREGCGWAVSVVRRSAGAGR